MSGKFSVEQSLLDFNQFVVSGFDASSNTLGHGKIVRSIFTVDSNLVFSNQYNYVVEFYILIHALQFYMISDTTFIYYIIIYIIYIIIIVGFIFECKILFGSTTHKTLRTRNLFHFLHFTF